jgi:NAD(P)-dependent dehydrogenase (short-subunit alcohol dehydrogenase family)
VRDFSGKVGVVTGAGRGIGRAVARVLAQRGMAVVLSDVAAAQPARVAVGLFDGGPDALGVVCDVTDADDVSRLAELTMERFGRVDLLCNNAGVVSGGPTWEIPLDDWNRVLSVNLWGAIHCIHAFVPLMVDNESGGHVVNVASMAAVTPVRGIAPYNVSKHGLLALSETLHADLGAAGSSVGVTVVMPGRVATSLGAPSGEPDPASDPRNEAAAVDAGVLTADAVAAQIVDAVERDQLYLFTHGDSIEYTAAHFSRILGR